MIILLVLSISKLFYLISLKFFKPKFLCFQTLFEVFREIGVFTFVGAHIGSTIDVFEAGELATMDTIVLTARDLIVAVLNNITNLRAREFFRKFHRGSSPAFNMSHRKSHNCQGLYIFGAQPIRELHKNELGAILFQSKSKLRS